jgi:membrane associated rhomboid family serine protease
MTRTPRAPSQGGLLGVATLVCGVAAITGLAFDFSMRGFGGFWVGAQSGGAAAIGASAAIFVVLAARSARWLLARKTSPVVAEQKGGEADADALT